MNEILIPKSFELSQNYPNPFNPITTISFSLAQFGTVSIIIYDLTGREVITLIDKPMSTGFHSLNWDASVYTSGIYFYRLTTNKMILQKKMILLW
jgi:hypothetical protein